MTEITTLLSEKTSIRRGHRPAVERGTSVAVLSDAMSKTPTLAYVVLLLLAFAVGLAGTIAASRLVLAAWEWTPPATERPASIPTAPPPRAVARTIEC